jgi:hypothetical protein
MDAGGIQQGQGGIGLPHQQGNLGAAEDDTLGAGLLQRVNGPLVGVPGGLLQLASHQFFNDDAMQFPLVSMRRRLYGNIELGHRLVVKAVVHGVAGAEQTEAGKTEFTGPARRRFDNAEQRQGCRPADLGEGLVHGV